MAQTCAALYRKGMESSTNLLSFCHLSSIAFVRKSQEDENAVSLMYLTEKFYSS